MDHVERELERIRAAIRRPHWRQGELRAAAAALAWALSPEKEQSPMMFVTGKPEMEPEKLPTIEELKNTIGGMRMVIDPALLHARREKRASKRRTQVTPKAQDQQPGM